VIDLFEKDHTLKDMAGLIVKCLDFCFNGTLQDEPVLGVIFKKELDPFRAVAKRKILTKKSIIMAEIPETELNSNAYDRISEFIPDKTDIFYDFLEVICRNDILSGDNNETLQKEINRQSK
jgi:hypothetical protein